VTVRPAFVYALVGALLVALVHSLMPGGPASPSADSLDVANARLLLHRARLRSAAFSAVNDSLRVRLGARGDSVRRVVTVWRDSVRLVPPAPDSAVNAVNYWRARSKAAEVLLDLTVTADSILQDSLVRGWENERAETGRLRALLASTEDSLGRIEVQVGQLARDLAKARRPCRVGDVAGGWDPIGGGGAVVVGASCNVWRLVRG
jgi:hypothetical protein